MEKISFTNWTNEEFMGRFGGQEYRFIPGQAESYDEDKHYMLVLLSKQLADRELLKRIRTVGRDPNNQETWGKSLDEGGKPFIITHEARLDLMRKAIGDLVDKPIKIPEEEEAEAGTTEKVSEDVASLKAEIAELKGLIRKVVEAKLPESPTTPSPKKEEVESSMLRESLLEMAKEYKVEKAEEMTKEELISAVASAKK